MATLPGHHGRAPLRHPARPTRTPRARLFPAITAGLRCGRAYANRGRVDYGSSRPSRPGSVAARTTTDSRSPTRGSSSRPSRPGSVAARCCGRPGRERRQALPGHHGRAPLRQVSLPWPILRLPRALPGHHGRAPLRQDCAGDGRLPGHLFPAITAGLRCGEKSWTVSVAVPALLFPAITAGLRCGNTCCSDVCSRCATSSRPSRPGSVAASRRGGC